MSLTCHIVYSILHNSFVFLLVQCLAFTGYNDTVLFVFIFFVMVIILNIIYNHL